MNLYLLRVTQKNGKTFRGNVHTGAKPPWLQEDEEEDDDTTKTFKNPAGPSEDDFLYWSESILEGL